MILSPISRTDLQARLSSPLPPVLLEALPAGYRQTLITLDEATRELQDLFARTLK